MPDQECRADTETKGQIPKSLQAVLMAGIAPETVPPTLVRSVAQWCEVLPLNLVARALRQAGTGENALHDFRQVALSLAHHMNSQPAVEKREPPRNAIHNSTPTEPTVTLATLPSAIRAAIAVQDAYEAMSEAEYQNELARRLQKPK